MRAGGGGGNALGFPRPYTSSVKKKWQPERELVRKGTEDDGRKVGKKFTKEPDLETPHLPGKKFEKNVLKKGRYSGNRKTHTITTSTLIKSSYGGYHNTRKAGSSDGV